MNESNDDLHEEKLMRKASHPTWLPWRQTDTRRSLMKKLDALSLDLDILELAGKVCKSESVSTSVAEEPSLPKLEISEIRRCCETQGLLKVLSLVSGTWKERLRIVWDAIKDAYVSGGSEHASLIRESLLVALRLHELGVLIPASTIAFRYATIGDMTRALKWYSLADAFDSRDSRMAILLSQVELLGGEWNPDMTRGSLVRSRPGTALIVLHNSLPWSLSGYATRSHGLLQGLRAEGWNLTVVTRPGFPAEDIGFKSDEPVTAEDLIDGIKYRRLETDGYAYNQCPVTAYIDRYAFVLEREIRRTRPAIIHAASNYISGIAAVIAARRTGVPVVYEVRGLWDLTRSSKQPEWEGSDQQRMQRLMEIRTAHAADGVIAITGALKDKLIESGVAESKISVVPNGVDTDRFQPRPADESLQTKLNIGNRVVIGYIGSIVGYEGLADLVAAVAGLCPEYGDAFHVLVVGDGRALPELEAAIEAHKVESHFTIIGRIPHSEVEQYYSIFDICPFPRKSVPVCEAVSPLKPFEAMAMGKAIVVSSVKPLMEFVEHERTGLVFPKGDVAALGGCLGRLIGDQSLRDTLGINAREFVEKERHWRLLGGAVLNAYRDALRSASSSNTSSSFGEGFGGRETNAVDEAIAAIGTRLRRLELQITPTGSQEQTEISDALRADRDAAASAVEVANTHALSLQSELQSIQQKFNLSEERSGELEGSLLALRNEAADLKGQRRQLRAEVDRLLKSSGMAVGMLVQASSTSFWSRVTLPLRLIRFALSASYRSRWKQCGYANMDADVWASGQSRGPRGAASLIWYRWQIGRVSTTEALRLGFLHLKDGDPYGLEAMDARKVSFIGLKYGSMLLRTSWSEPLRYQLEWRYRRLGMVAEADALKESKHQPIGDSRCTEEEISTLRASIVELPGQSADVDSNTIAVERGSLKSDVIIDRCMTFGVPACEQWVRGLLGHADDRAVWSAMWNGLKDCHKHSIDAEVFLRDALIYGKKLSLHPRFMQWRYHRVGDIIDSVECTRRLPVWERKKNVRWDDYEAKVQMLRTGWQYPEPEQRRVDTTDRVIYLLHNTLPWSSSGYASRSHGLLRSLRDKSIDVIGVTRPGFPWDRFADGDTPSDVQMQDEVDGVPYHRIRSDGKRYGKVPLDVYLHSFETLIGEVMDQQNPRLIHAASNFMNGVAGGSAAISRGIPFVYEVRGLWEVTKASRQPCWAGSQEYTFMSNMERDAAIHATRVITLTEGLRDEMVKRGVDRDKIVLVPNGVDSSRFVPRDPDEALRAELGIGDRLVIGYIGSIVPYEGLDDLIDAVAVLRETHRDGFRVLIIGDGKSLAELREQSANLGLDDYILFTGRVPHEDVERYYSLIDICPFPRKPQLVCELVSPLKPFESMAMCKAVVASNVQALGEIVQDGVTGLLFEKGSTASLVEALDRLLKDGDLRTDLGLAAREWVVAERDWSSLGQLVRSVYDSVSHGSLNSVGTPVSHD